MAQALVFIRGIEFAMMMVTYYQFILEEAIQSALMSCYLATRYRRLSRTAPVLDRLERKTIPQLETYTNIWGWIAPFNRPAFKAFAVAARLAVESYRAALP